MYVITMVAVKEGSKDQGRVAVIKVKDKDMESFEKVVVQAYCQGDPVFKDVADLNDHELINI